MEREAVLYERLSGKRIRCHVCQWRCIINPGRTGLCRARLNRDGKLVSLNYGEATAAAVDPVEKKPLFHFFPGSSVFSLGTWGCNFHCQHCQNWEIACVDVPASSSRELSPEKGVESARHHGCAGIAWTYNEPSVWFEYTLDSAKLAHEKGLYTVYVTNGYLTPEALDMIAPHLDVWRVDVKGFNDEAYRRLARVRHWQGILDVTKRARQKWGMHVEVVTNIIPGVNDDEKQLQKIAEWIRGELGELIPWHVTRFYPAHKLKHLPPTPLASLERACEIGRRAGLEFVYVGNVCGHESGNTFCHVCGKMVVRRNGYDVQVTGLDGRGGCMFCGADLNFRQAGENYGR